MNSQRLARLLAVPVTGGAWTAEAIAGRLVPVLPPAVHVDAPAVGQALVEACPGLFAPRVSVVAEALALMPGFARIHAYFSHRGLWPSPSPEPPVMAPIKAFAGLDLPDLPTTGALADWLELPVGRLEHLADAHARAEAHGEPAVNHYHYLWRPKRSGGRRLIEAPKPILKSLQRRILRGILDSVPVHGRAFGFVRGRSCVEAAARHAGEALVVRFDLKDFFPSLGAGRVFGLFRCLGYPQGVADVLTALATTRTPGRVLDRLDQADRDMHRARHLPQGAPTSPALANLMAFSLDRRLAGLARRLDVSYTRYADDLCFSGDASAGPVLLKAVPGIVADEGLALNGAKTRVMPSGARQRVTGIVVNRHVNVTRADFDRLKAVIHACARPDTPRIMDPGFRARLDGQITWVETLNPRRGLKLRRLLARAELQRGAVIGG